LKGGLSSQQHSPQANIMNERKRDAENSRKVLQIETSLTGKFKVFSSSSISLLFAMIYFSFLFFSSLQTILDPQRRFVREGDILFVSSKKKVSKRYAILFNDIFILTKVDHFFFLFNFLFLFLTFELSSSLQKKKSTSATTKLEFVERYSLKDADVINRQDQDGKPTLFFDFVGCCVFDERNALRCGRSGTFF
jgi:hypothetical protein